MNQRGHVETLVARHPGNRNAVKAGVYSERCREDRVSELEASIAARSADEVQVEVLRGELAALIALAEAMDLTLAQDGLLGPHGEPRVLLSVRLRLNEKLRRTLQAYSEAVAGQANVGAEAALVSDRAVQDDGGRTDLLSEIATGQRQRSIEALVGQEFNPEAFLSSIILTHDPAVSTTDKLKARRLLTARKKKHPWTCLCFAGREARDELEFRDWIDELREAGVVPDDRDRDLARLVRRLAAGERLLPWGRCRRRTDAFERVVAEEVRREQGELIARSDPTAWVRTGPELRPFWALLASPDRHTQVRERLQAFAALDEAGAFGRCSCAPSSAQLEEDHLDEAYAYVIRLVVQRRYRAALCRVEFPGTYLAIRDAVEARLPKSNPEPDAAPEPASGTR